MKRGAKLFLPLVGGLCVLIGLALMLLSGLPQRVALPSFAEASMPVPTRTLTPEPIVPTRTPLPSSTLSPVITPSLTALPTVVRAPTSRPTLPLPTSATPALVETPVHTPTSSPTPAPPAFATPTAIPTPSSATASDTARFVVPAQERFRIGVSLPDGASEIYDLQALGVGWVMDWSVRASTALPDGVEYAQTVRMKGGKLTPDAATLTSVAASRPGATWLVANEADVRWQDNVDPATYARLYHEAYVAIKAGDGSAVVVAGGIAQPTPLRLRYLDLVLEAYRAAYGEALPAQGWHVHNYMLREERDSWGVDIPPGIPDASGVRYSVDDSGNVDAFRAQIIAFRRWMASRDYGGLPLLVSEFGVPMPADYGFPLERVAAFLRETWRFFLTASDPTLGDPADGGRLVQRWCWFSMRHEPYPTGNLLDANGDWTPLAQVWISYVSE